MIRPTCAVCSHTNEPKLVEVTVITNNRERYSKVGFEGYDRLGYDVVFRCHGEEERRYFTAKEWEDGKHLAVARVFTGASR